MLYAFFISVMNAACTVQLTLPYLMTPIIFGEQYKLWSSSLYRFLHLVTSSLLGPNIHFGNTFSNTHNLRSSVNLNNFGVSISCDSNLTNIKNTRQELCVEPQS